ELYTVQRPVQSPRVGQMIDTRAEGTTEGRKQNRNKSKSWKIGEIKYRQNITCWNCNQKGHFQNQSSKLVASRGKEVNIAAGDSDDALICCVENTVEDRIMDFGASFHATYYKEELDRFKLCSSKVRLADDMTPAHTSVQTSVRYIAPAHIARTNKEYKQGLRKVNAEYNRHKI
ncbi:hypothetical protein Tco_0321103, partial [Tanacetum coccineum]